MKLPAIVALAGVSGVLLVAATYHPHAKPAQPTVRAASFCAAGEAGLSVTMAGFPHLGADDDVLVGWESITDAGQAAAGRARFPGDGGVYNAQPVPPGVVTVTVQWPGADPVGVTVRVAGCGGSG